MCGDQNPNLSGKWFLNKINEETGAEKGDLINRHAMMKELVKTVPLFISEENDQAVANLPEMIYDEHHNQRDYRTTGLTRHFTTEWNAWRVRHERLDAWRKLWNRVIDYRRVGDTVDWRWVNRVKGRPDIIRDHPDNNKIPAGLGKIKKSKAKYKFIKK